MADIKSILQKIAGVALPVGAGVLNAETGGALKPLTDRLLATLGAALPDPAARAALEQAAIERSAELNKAEMEYAAQIAAIAQQDRASARLRESTVKDSTPKILAYSIVAFFCLYSTMLLLEPVAERWGLKPDPVLIGTIGTVLGYAIGEVKTVFNYYFGSSQGSMVKTEVLAELAKKE